MRTDGRSPNALRRCTIEPGYVRCSTGSALITTGQTRVICTANTEERPPPWLSGGGWVTAQYAMLPGATHPRGRRDPGGRGKEIQRLIGRSLRAAVDLGRLVGPQGPVSIICDCDVLEADGGTRTAAITGAFVAMAIAIRKLLQSGDLATDPIVSPVAAVSVGLVEIEQRTSPAAMLDLCYDEDSRAVVDLNVVKLQAGGYVEIQGTGEHGTFSRPQLSGMLDLADAGIEELLAVQQAALESVR